MSETLRGSLSAKHPRRGQPQQTSTRPQAHRSAYVLPYTLVELTIRAHLAVHSFSCCCCGHTSPLLDAAHEFGPKTSCCFACQHYACGDCTVPLTNSNLHLIPRAADYHQVPADALLQDAFFYVCGDCGEAVVVEPSRTSGVVRKQTEMVVFKGKACKRCGKQCGEGRLKFKVGKAEAFVKETKVGLGIGEEDGLASPDMFERSEIEARLSLDERSREWSQESVDGMEGKQETRKDGDEPTVSPAKCSLLPHGAGTEGLRQRRGGAPLQVDVSNPERLAAASPLLFNPQVLKAAKGTQPEPSPE